MTYRNTLSPLNALRVSLICGVSATALALSVGTAHAQTPPGTDPITNAVILENLNGTAVPTNTTGALLNGWTPQATLYSSETAVVTSTTTATSGYYLTNSSGAIVQTPSISAIAASIPSASLPAGYSWANPTSTDPTSATSASYSTETPGVTSSTTATSGYYLVNSTTGAIVPASSISDFVASVSSANLPQGYSWANPTSTDPNASYKWASATYANAAGWSTTGLTPNAAGQYLYDQTAKGMVTSGSCPTNDTCVLVKPTDALPSSSLLAATYSGDTYQTAQATSVNTSPAGPNGISSTTTAFPGGVVYSNNQGQSTAIGPNGTYGVGNSSTWISTDGTSKTVISDGQYQSTVTTGPNAGQTTIVGGMITSSGTANLNNVNVGAALTVTGKTTLNGGLAVTGGTTTDTLAVGSAGQAKIDVNGNISTSGSLTVKGPSAFGSGGQATIDANGNFATSGTGSFGGLLSTNGISNTGDIATTTLHTTGNASIGGNESVAGTLGVTGLASLNGGAQVSNGLSVTGGTTTDTLKVTGLSTTNGINNTGALNQNGVATFTNGAAANGTTTIRGGYASLGTSGMGSITLDSTVDPMITVTNGTSTTQINNGNITTTNGSVATQTVNATVGNIGTANIGTAYVNSLNVNPGGTVNMGGNQITNVGTPINGTDAANKAYVDSGLAAANNNITKAYQGTAIALALSQPIFAPGQSWAVRAGWGGFEGENAGGISVAGIIGRDWFGAGSTIAIDGGVGFADNVVAGKAGVTIGFGGGYVPMK